VDNLTYNYEEFLKSFTEYRFGNSNSGFDAGFSTLGKQTKYAILYAVQQFPNYQMWMWRHTINFTEDFDEEKYMKMFNIHLVLVQLKESFEACFYCFEFFKKGNIPHCHRITGHISEKPIAMTRNLDFIGDYNTPEFVGKFQEMLAAIINPDDAFFEADDLRGRIEVDKILGIAYKRADCGFSSLSTAKSYFIDDNSNIAFKFDIYRNVVNKHLFNPMHDMSPMIEYFIAVSNM